jgi:hypothetical protein
MIRKIVKEEACGVNVHDLQVENAKLKIELETLQFKLSQSVEKYSIIENQLNELKKTDIEKIMEEADRSRRVISDLRFQIDNDTKNIELETENKKLKAQIDIQVSENNHLKKLLDAYRAMPDVKNMIDGLSSLAVPHIEELKEFSKMLSDSKVSQLCDELSATNKIMRDTLRWTDDRRRPQW